MIQIAAAGDIHFSRNCGGRLKQHFSLLRGEADFLLLAGDLTQVGHPDEARVLADELAKCPVPVLAVLGNHDYQMNQVGLVVDILSQAGVRVLEGATHIMNIREQKVGVAGIKGFGGGFIGACGSDFGEPEMKAFMRQVHATYAD